ncbi:MAG TPA: hypothetical protein VFA98_01105 [Thermoanaerobaculia bacterium]|nr:hypothetical protein [Thermoanaerobaculia bacterium]
MKKVIVDLSAPETDESGRLELLLKSACPYCGESVFIAREGPRSGLVTLHASVGPKGCQPFDALCRSNPAEFIRLILLSADRKEVERFLERTEDEEDEEVIH